MNRGVAGVAVRRACPRAAATTERSGSVSASELGHVSVYLRGLRDKSPLHAALASADRVIWAAGDLRPLDVDAWQSR